MPGLVLLLCQTKNQYPKNQSTILKNQKLSKRSNYPDKTRHYHWTKSSFKSSGNGGFAFCDTAAYLVKVVFRFSPSKYRFSILNKLLNAFYFYKPFRRITFTSSIQYPHKKTKSIRFSENQRLPKKPNPIKTPLTPGVIFFIPAAICQVSFI